MVGKSDREVTPLVQRLDPNFVVDGTTNALFAAQIPFGRLNRNVPEQILDLRQFQPRGKAGRKSCGGRVALTCRSLLSQHTREPRARLPSLWGEKACLLLMH